MAVAVKTNAEARSASPLDRLAVASLVGVFYVVACLGILIGLLPALWWGVLGITPSPATSIVLGILLVAAGVGLAMFGASFLGAKAARGTRAGIFIGVTG
ncbi:MAG: hypothetical protein ACRD36_05495, partial [Candidatus Acidiferrum sp.]